MKKRIISMLMAAVMWLTCIMPMLTGCADANKDYYTVGEWLDIVELNFNMLYYDQAEPYFPNVAPEDEDYSTAQIAAEWGLVDPALGIDLNQKVTKEYAADTLVKAMNFNYEAQVDIADTDKINSGNLHNIAIAVNEGIFALNSGKFEPKKVVSRTEADQAMAVAMDKWINLSYDENFNKSTVQAAVVNLGGLDSAQSAVQSYDFDVTYTGDTRLIDENGNLVDNSIKTITFAAGQNIGFGVGSVLSLPSDEYMPMPYAVVVEAITTNSDGSVTAVTRNATVEEVYETLHFQYSGELDLDNAVVYDMQGNRLSGGAQPFTEGMRLVGDDYQAIKNGGTAVQMVDEVDGTGSVTIGNGIKVSYSVNDNEISFTIDTNIGDNVKVNFNKSSAISLDTAFNGGFLPPRVDYARMVLDFNDHIGGNLAYSQDFSANNGLMVFSDGGSLSGDDLAEFYDVTSALIGILDEEMGDAAGELSAPLFKFVVPTPLVGVSVDFIVRLNLSLEGEISFSVDTNASFGVEYTKADKIRPITKFGFEKNLDMKAKAELTLFLGLGLSALTFTVVDAGVDLGVGAKVNTKFYQIDSVTGAVTQECALPTGMFGGTNPDGTAISITLEEDMRGCVDFIAYPIVQISICTSDCFLGKFVDGYDYRFMGEEDAFYKFHYETDCGKVDECTRENGVNFTIEVGDNLTLNTDSAVLAIGETYDKIKVRTLPEQYSAADLVFAIEDQSVATTENLIQNAIVLDWAKKNIAFLGGGSGSVYRQTKYKKYTANDSAQSKVTGVADGVTMLTVSTKDGRYSAQCKVVVGNGGLKESILRTLIIDKFSLKLVPGASGQINVIEAPADYTIADVTFTSSDTSVATVSGSGTVTAVGNGFATIKVSTTDGAFSASCMVYVSSTAATA